MSKPKSKDAYYEALRVAAEYLKNADDEMIWGEAVAVTMLADTAADERCQKGRQAAIHSIYSLIPEHLRRHR
jgi:hypothetical protein